MQLRPSCVAIARYLDGLHSLQHGPTFNVSPRGDEPVGVLSMANKRGRDAGNGQFIPVEEAKRRPKTTTIETIPAPAKKGGKKK